MYRQLLSATALLVLPTAAFANCPASLSTTARLSCLNASLNAAAATIATLQTSNAALETANAALETGMWSLEGQLEDAQTRLDLHDQDIADLLTASSNDAAFTALQSDVANIAVNVADLSTTVGTFTALQSDVANLAVNVADLSATVGAIDVGDLFTYLTVDTATNSVIFSGANVYVQSGSGATNGAVNGLGNLIVGYDEDTRLAYGSASDRTGSHNVVVGMGHSYSSYGGLVTGTLNTLNALGASVIGGAWNTADGIGSAIVAGSSNTASGFYSATLGGSENTSASDYAAISGGRLNDAESQFSSILGGYDQTTTVDYETVPTGDADVGNLLAYVTVDTATNSVIFSGANVYVQSGSGATDGALNGLGNLIIGYNETPADLGYGAYVGSDRGGSHNLVVGMGHSYTSYSGFVDGVFNTVQGSGASVCGGMLNVASGTSSAVSGGVFNHAMGDFSSVSGGYTNTAVGQWSSVLGGSTNSAGALGATVSGGIYNLADGVYSAILGGAFQSTAEEDETFPQ